MEAQDCPGTDPKVKEPVGSSVTARNGRWAETRRDRTTVPIPRNPPWTAECPWNDLWARSGGKETRIGWKGSVLNYGTRSGFGLPAMAAAYSPTCMSQAWMQHAVLSWNGFEWKCWQVFAIVPQSLVWIRDPAQSPWPYLPLARRSQCHAESAAGCSPPQHCTQPT